MIYYTSVQLIRIMSIKYLSHLKAHIKMSMAMPVRKVTVLRMGLRNEMLLRIVSIARFSYN